MRGSARDYERPSGAAPQPGLESKARRQSRKRHRALSWSAVQGRTVLLAHRSNMHVVYAKRTTHPMAGCAIIQAAFGVVLKRGSGLHETARCHHLSWWRRRLADRGACAARQAVKRIGVLNAIPADWPPSKNLFKSISMNCVTQNNALPPNIGRWITAAHPEKCFHPKIA